MNGKIKLKGRLKTYLQSAFILGFLMALVDIWVYFVDYRAGIILNGFTVFYFAVLAFMIIYNKPLIMHELISFATQYGQIQKQLLRELELPHCLLDDTGKVVWTNEAFERVIHKEKGFHKHIGILFPEITKEKIPGIFNFNDNFLDIEYQGRDFHVTMKKISLKEMAENSDIIEGEDYEGFLIALYMFDQTALKIALKENDNQSLAIGMIYLDNYDEALESVEEVKRSLLVALIDRKINKYFSSMDGITRKVEKDKYFLILRKKALHQLQEARFDLLEDIKTVSIGNEMAVTLSIGIGVDGLTYSQNFEFSRVSIDLALGRGGDQAVVKSPDQVTYYGGKSQQIEKNTRVKARVKAHALREIITSKDKVLVMGHRLADVDSFGAAIGIYRVAKTLDRKVHVVINDISTSVKPLIEAFRNNPDYEEDMFLSSQEAIEVASGNNNTVLVVVDVNRPSITECPELLKLCKSIVVLDHHRQSNEIIENATLSYIEPYASSTCEMVAEILQYIGDPVRIRNYEADSMYSGIMIDTNNFMAKTGVRTFEAAAFLKRNGADIVRVRKMFREDAIEYKAKAETVKNAEIYRNSYAISQSPVAGIKSPTIVAAQAANELLNIIGVKASFVVTQYQDDIYISARSIDEVNVQLIMERLGGGGHMTIAGAQLESGTPEYAIQIIKDTIDIMIQEGDL